MHPNVKSLTAVRLLFHGVIHDEEKLLMLIVVVYRTVIQLLPILNNLSFLLFKDIYYSDYFIVINIRLVFMRLASHNVITLVLNFKSLVLCS